MQSQRLLDTSILNNRTMYPTQYRGYEIDRFVIRGGYFADPVGELLTTHRLRASTIKELKALIDEVCDEPTIADLFDEADRILAKPIYA